jgi:hypothetical protein
MSTETNSGGRQHISRRAREETTEVCSAPLFRRDLRLSLKLVVAAH